MRGTRQVVPALGRQAETAQSYTFYEFLTNYHERDNPYADKATVPSGSGTTAVLDGQQRLTSLNIALCSSFAERRVRVVEQRGRVPVKRLYLNLVDEPDDEGSAQYDCGSSPTGRPPRRTAKPTSGSGRRSPRSRQRWPRDHARAGATRHR